MKKSLLFILSRTDLATSFMAFLFLAFFVFLGVYQLSPPDVVPISAPHTEFSSSRAIKHLEIIAKKPHPMGSPEHTEVRDYILKELATMEISPEIQKTTIVNPQRYVFLAGTVHNLVATLKGTNNTKALLLVGHYDSVSTGPGASDDGAAVAAMLETLRALKAGS
ncbi:MAG: M28 family peptidase, partial [Nitrospira sp.]|nr:M28 family peptidase [Nitrospira sp.]